MSERDQRPGPASVSPAEPPASLNEAVAEEAWIGAAARKATEHLSADPVVSPADTRDAALAKLRRRQITRLTEALEQIAARPCEVPKMYAAYPDCGRCGFCLARAVLADEEDAPDEENFAATVEEARRLMAYGTEDEVIAFLIGKPVEVVAKVSGAGEEDARP